MTSNNFPKLGCVNHDCDKCKAIKQPKQEPVAWLTDRETMHFDKEDAWRDCDGFIQPLYTEPPKKEWVGLTDEEIKQGFQESWVTEQAWQSAVWWAEQRLKELNQCNGSADGCNHERTEFDS